jgi:hypothetical protein
MVVLICTVPPPWESIIISHVPSSWDPEISTCPFHHDVINPWIRKPKWGFPAILSEIWGITDVALGVMK